MTTEEAKKIGELCSMLNAKERASLQKYLDEIVMRDALQKIGTGIDPRDVIFMQLMHYQEKQEQLIENGYWIRKTNKLNEPCLKTKWYEMLKSANVLIHEQFAEYKKTRIKNRLKPSDQK